MTGFMLNLYAGLIDYCEKVISRERIDKRYSDWENAQEMRKDYGFDDKTMRKIPKRRIKNRASRIKHGY